jgi:hypothetical protein
MLTSSDIGMTIKAVRASASEHPKEMAQLVDAVRDSLECKELVLDILREISAEDSTGTAIAEECYALIALGIAAGTMLPRASSAWLVAGIGRA